MSESQSQPQNQTEPPFPSQPSGPVNPSPTAETRRRLRERRARLNPANLKLPRLRRPLRFGPPFWTITGLLSLVVNVILIALLLSIGSQLFTLKNLVEDQVLGGLYKNFVSMDQAHIKTTIPVNTSVPAKFDLPLKTDTVVTLTQDTRLENAQLVSLSTGGLTIIDAPMTIILAKGTQLPVALDLVVPVDQQIPVSLSVNVDIPLSQTDLHAPFTGLQEVVRPYYAMLEEVPNDWSEIMCGPEPGKWCQRLFR